MTELQCCIERKIGQLEARGRYVVTKKWAMLESGLDLLDDTAPDECSH